VAEAFELARKWLPWSSGPTFRQIMDEARRSATNPITLTGLARRGIDERASLEQLRGAVYQQELLPSAVLLLALTAAVFWIAATRQPSPPLPRGETGGSAALNGDESGASAPLHPPVPPPAKGEERYSRLQIALAALTLVDLLLNVWLRDVDTGPIRSLVDQSPVLQRLAREGRKTRGRIVSPLGNLPIVAGVAGVPAYRTLDIPVARLLLQQAMADPLGFASFREMAVAMNRMGATLRIAQPGESFHVDRRLRLETVNDPTLARWLTGRPHPTGEAATFKLLPFRPASRFDLLKLSPGGLELALVSKLEWHEQYPESIEVTGIVRPAEDKDSVFVVSLKQTPDPEWTGVWKNGDQRVPAEIRRNADGSSDSFRVARVPGPGTWTLELRYEGRAARAGLIASGVSWAIWLLLWFAPWRRWQSRESNGTATA
jgi:hypothetical protein